MNTSGEAADQVVRMSLEAGEAALKISGTGAKQLAVILYAILKEQKKTKGRARLETLVRSGKPLTVFSVKESDLKKFVQEAKRYGILYCAVRDPKGSRDGMVDIMVKEEDAPRINRIVERFKFASVMEAAQIKTEIQKSREEKGRSAPAEKSPKEKSSAEKSKGKQQPEKKTPEEKSPSEKAGQKSGQPEPEIQKPEKSKEDKLMDELMGEPVKKEGKQKNPSLARTEKSHPSEPISGKQSRTAGGTSKPYMTTVPEKPSVRKELNELKAERKKEAEAAKRNEPARDTKSKNTKPVQHKQPQAKKKPRKVKER